MLVWYACYDMLNSLDISAECGLTCCECLSRTGPFFQVVAELHIYGAQDTAQAQMPKGNMYRCSSLTGITKHYVAREIDLAFHAMHGKNELAWTSPIQAHSGGCSRPERNGEA